MNSFGKNRFRKLYECRACGMDSGERMVTETLPEKFFVVCTVCGYKTRPHLTQGAATHEWNGDRR